MKENGENDLCLQEKKRVSFDAFVSILQYSFKSSDFNFLKRIVFLSFFF